MSDTPTIPQRCPKEGCDGYTYRAFGLPGAVVACMDAPPGDGYFMGAGSIVVSDLTGMCPLLVEAGVVVEAEEIPDV